MIHALMDEISKRGGTCSYGVNPDDSVEGELAVPQNTQVILTVGGDGTLIRAAQNTFGKNIPLIGINRGHLGYLCDLDEDSAFEAIARMMADDFFVEERMMLSGHVLHKDGSTQESVQALNDIVLSSHAGLQIIHLRVFVNGKYLYAYHCDGMICSTPTGSTAYNLSAHGPIVDPKTNLILLTPINPHTLNARSIILDAYDELEMELDLQGRETVEVAEISFDGNHKRPLYPGERLVIHRARETTGMVRLSEQSFLDRIRIKMQAD